MSLFLCLVCFSTDGEVHCPHCKGTSHGTWQCRICKSSGSSIPAVFRKDGSPHWSLTASLLHEEYPSVFDELRNAVAAFIAEYPLCDEGCTDKGPDRLSRWDKRKLVVEAFLSGPRKGPSFLNNLDIDE